MFQPHFDEAKFRDLMLYLAHRCRDAEFFGSTKLCKLLYYSDYAAFARTGRPITGAEYIRQEHGPMPREFYHQRNKLIDAGQGRMVMRVVFDHDEERLVPLVPESYFEGKFSGLELQAVEQTLSRMKEMTATEACEYSRGEVGWIIADDGEAIPYEAAYLVPESDVELNAVIDKAFAAWVKRQDGN